MDGMLGNLSGRFKQLQNVEGKRMAIKLLGFYAMGWTLRKLIK
ncbi:uncharacterized protein LOC26527576 [Drosophila mojavensis]|uniref:Uncharacterized protein n=2 Tax=mojavensis species complex TaxID=198037 RepID=A0A0Q9X0H4_DROMO|nr:uncharacterized protein LOC26527576 [Drosophila mojavensis]XP_017856334.1 PREDICTED: uncharacterized protein LOC108609135 [Drosophila arizonae]KRG01049.1 uncharacterized protein Dmoj_GI25935 [Drosophila mojavensis]